MVTSSFVQLKDRVFSWETVLVAHVNRRFFLAGLGALTLALVACGKKQSLENPNGVDLSGADFGKDFSLKDAQGNLRSLGDFKGKAVLVFFGFTQCPDVCPTALLRAAEVKTLLGEQGDRLQVLFITVDPERDTPEILQAYTKAFDKSFIALYGDEQQTQAVANDFKIFYQKVPTGSSYTIDHTALSYVYDAQGGLRLALRHTQTAEEYAADIRQVLALG
jgi:protein SCO1/2